MAGSLLYGGLSTCESRRRPRLVSARTRTRSPRIGSVAGRYRCSDGKMCFVSGSDRGVAVIEQGDVEIEVDRHCEYVESGVDVGGRAWDSDDRHERRVLAVDRETAVRVDGPVATEGRHVDLEAGVPADVDDRFVVVVVAVLDGVDQLGHRRSGNAGILVLVA